jgi:transcription initiation factor TFIIE subunit alpha
LLTWCSHVRSEIKEGQTRPQSRTYYYLDYRASIDAIKWRVYTIDKAVQGNTIVAEERKEYFCERCKSEWTTMDVLTNSDERGFLCPKCGWVLLHDPDSNRGGHEQSTKLNAQFRFITDLLPKIDQVVIPENNFETAFASARPVVRDESNPSSETVPVESRAAKPTAVKGMANTGPTSISVTLTASEGPSEADLAAEKARKEAIAAQNALPVHFTHSTISGEQVKFGQQPLYQSSQPLDDKKELGQNTPSANGEADIDVDDYFARLKAEQAKEAEQEKEDEYETDEEDEDDFEDVVPTGTGSGAGTPASSIGGADTKNPLQQSGSGLAGVLKKSGSASASGTSTRVTSPVTGPGTPNSEGRPSKKVRIEEPSAKGADEESEEDMEFEDV